MASELNEFIINHTFNSEVIKSKTSITCLCYKLKIASKSNKCF